MSTSGKGKVPISMNGVETYSKKALDNKICRLTAINAQLITNKIKIEKVRVNLKADRVRLFDKKNSLVVKKKELRTEIVALNTAGYSNVPVRGH